MEINIYISLESHLTQLPQNNKSNYATWDVQVEANLAGHPKPVHFYRKKHNKKIFDLENLGQGHGV